MGAAPRDCIPRSISFRRGSRISFPRRFQAHCSTVLLVLSREQLHEPTCNVEILHRAKMGQDVYIRNTHVPNKHIYRKFFVFTTSVGRAPTNRMAYFHRLLFTVLCCSAVLEVCCITVEEFYSFGESSGDSFLTRVLDGSAGPITLRTEFPFSNQSYRNVYVSTTLNV